LYFGSTQNKNSATVSEGIEDHNGVRSAHGVGFVFGISSQEPLRHFKAGVC
jgi:hypothetical protein